MTNRQLLASLGMLVLAGIVVAIVLMSGGQAGLPELQRKGPPPDRQSPAPPAATPSPTVPDVGERDLQPLPDPPDTDSPGDAAEPADEPPPVDPEVAAGAFELLIRRLGAVSTTREMTALLKSHDLLHPITVPQFTEVFDRIAPPKGHEIGGAVGELIEGRHYRDGDPEYMGIIAELYDELLRSFPRSYRAGAVTRAIAGALAARVRSVSPASDGSVPDGPGASWSAGRLDSLVERLLPLAGRGLHDRTAAFTALAFCGFDPPLLMEKLTLMLSVEGAASQLPTDTNVIALEGVAIRSADIRPDHRTRVATFLTHVCAQRRLISGGEGFEQRQPNRDAVLYSVRLLRAAGWPALSPQAERTLVGAYAGAAQSEVRGVYLGSGDIPRTGCVQVDEALKEMREAGFAQQAFRELDERAAKDGR